MEEGLEKLSTQGGLGSRPSPTFTTSDKTTPSRLFSFSFCDYVTFDIVRLS